MKKKSKSTTKKEAATVPSRGSDGRPYVTVYIKEEQLKVLEGHCEPLGIGVSTFMRTKALEAVAAAAK